MQRLALIISTANCITKQSPWVALHNATQTIMVMLLLWGLFAVENNTMSVPYKISFKKFPIMCSNTKSATCSPGINELNLLSFNEQKLADLESTQTELIAGWLSEKCIKNRVHTSIRISPYKDPSCPFPWSQHQLLYTYYMNRLFTMSHISVLCTKVCGS